MLFSVEAIIHPAIVTAGAVFGHTSSLPRPFLASGLPNPSPPAGFLAILSQIALLGDIQSRTALETAAIRPWRTPKTRHFVLGFKTLCITMVSRG